MTHIDQNSIKHFSVCILLSLIGGYGVAFALGASICKEWKDKKERNHWCWLDLLFDFLGCAVGMATHLWVFQSWNF